MSDTYTVALTYKCGCHGKADIPAPADLGTILGTKAWARERDWMKCFRRNHGYDEITALREHGRVGSHEDDQRHEYRVAQGY